jgi:hypothetical protein
MSNRKTLAFVYPVKGQAAAIEKLKQLIKAACDLVCDQVVIDPKQCLQDSDVLVVLICPETSNSPAVDELILTASRFGKRVVGVWVPGTTNGKLPSAINKYADATIVFDAKAVKAAVCGGQAIWSTPDGGPRPQPKTPRHKG